MPLGCPFVPDTIADHANGVTGSQTPATLATKYGAGNIKTASKNFTIHYRGHSVHFVKGVPVVVDVGLAAALAAISAPVV